ncbi:hypothetical protein [Haloarcula litorea]|uniref:hypothetical protein n=1 Tax=Haloarcula litorea TaxID=3032579 RepID=UPI0023E780E4|nr:hypothetical protein [Halomicroarcula sp. GDY20]
MCHHRGDVPDWDSAFEEFAEHDDDEADGEDELPSFLNEAGSEDAEVLTDGGDEA